MTNVQQLLDNTPSLDLRQLKVISSLGQGAKGVVFLIQTESSELLALKTISKSLISNKQNKDNNEYKRVIFEQQVLSSLHHPLLPKLRGVVTTDKIIGYAIDYCPGRDLHSLRIKQTEKMFSDDVIRYYTTNLFQINLTLSLLFQDLSIYIE